mmetsp:Transcript_8994/g.12217  ORF Transcript_8994/g.12217 Transcript_8994/m.12217 type:complete len:512 (+) Transcript_8994:602-2137(+)
MGEHLHSANDGNLIRKGSHASFGSVNEDECEETDPTNRFLRYKEPLGHGSFKVAYKGFDKKLGIEVAWNKVNLQGRHLTDEDRERLHREVQILNELDNPYIIKCYGAWRDKETGDINFITELFTSGTLRDFRRKHQGIKVRDMVAKWGKNVLRGLDYLHAHDPPIIHRDLKCDNIFINGHSGEVKIADLGLAALIQNSERAQTVIGTPEFMAPELYDERYDEKVDIYAFGMVLLELATLRFPYDELRNPAQIFKAVSSGRFPGALQDVEDPDVLEIIRACINHNYRKRPSAFELLQIPFFQEDEATDPSADPEDSIVVSGDLKEGTFNTVHMQLKLPKSAGSAQSKKQLVEFDFEVGVDTAEAISKEMGEAFELNHEEMEEIAAKVEYRVNTIMETMTTPDNNSQRRMKKSKSLAALVRVPVAVGQSKGVTVSVNPDVVNQYRIEVCTEDCPGILYNMAKTLHTLPMRVTNASVSTTEEGWAMDAFDILLEDECEITPEDMENRLRIALNL